MLTGLSENLVCSLTRVAASLPLVVEDIQMQLLDLLALVLAKRYYSPKNFYRSLYCTPASRPLALPLPARHTTYYCRSMYSAYTTLCRVSCHRLIDCC